MTVEIVILAMIAAFLGLRLYTVLGRRADHGDEPVQSRFDAQSGTGVTRLPEPAAERAVTAQPAANAAARPREMPQVVPIVEQGLRDIIAADRRFDPQAFVDGARAAYRMVLEAYWRGDRDELRHLCDAHVADSFIAAIDARQAAGEVVENRLVRIEEISMVAAAFTAPLARISLRFVADIAAVTRDASGTVIAGSLNDAIVVRDVWTFSRNVTSQAPDWLLDETDEG